MLSTVVTRIRYPGSKVTSSINRTFFSVPVILLIIFQTVCSFRNDLRITGGLCQIPGEDSCYGLDSRGSQSNRLFQKLGRTVNELQRYHWRPLFGSLTSEDCYNGGKFNGYQWANPSEPLSVVLLFDVQGTVAGIQFWMPYHEVLRPGQNYKYGEQPMMQNATTFTGINYFYITVYFMKPELICTEGRPASRLTEEGTISELFVQKGSSPKDSVKFPMTKKSAILNNWEQNNCYNSMGHHSFYDHATWQDDNCTSLQPIALLWDHKGDLTGIFFVVIGRATTAAIETPPSRLTEWVTGTNNSTASNPKCSLEIANAFGISSLHVFLTNKPYDFKCDEGVQENVPQNDQSISNTERPICIVGAGISGMEVAAQLEKKGFTVEIFERDSRVGGKMHTFRKDGDLQVEMCPLLLGPNNVRLGKLIDDFKLTRVSVNEKDRKGYAIQNMIPLDFPPTDRAEVRKAIVKYTQLIRQYQRDLQVGYLNATDELSQPILSWLKKHDLDKGLEGIFTFMITVEGYGALEDIPALYVLQFVDELTIANLLNENKQAFFFIKEGLDKFAEKMANSLKSKIFLNYPVTRISRKKDHQIIYFGKSKKRECSKVILAFPPLLPSVQSIVELSEEEVEVLDQVKVHRYTSAAHRIPTWNATIYSEWFDHSNNDVGPVVARPQGKGEPVAFLKQTNGKTDNIYSSYSWIRGNFDSAATIEDLELINRRLNESLLKISKDSETFFQENTEYSPHVNTNAIQEGFYKKFDAIQGRQGLFYATTLLSFEVIPKAIEMAEFFTNKYF